MVSRTVNFCDREHSDEDVIATSTVTFEHENVDLELDLCADHAQEYRAFQAVAQTWASAARPVNKSKPKRVRERPRSESSLPSAEPSADGEAPTANGRVRPRRDNDLSEVREWATREGYDVSARGRIPQEIHDAYRRYKEQDAHSRWDQAGNGSGRAAALSPTPNPDSASDGQLRPPPPASLRPAAGVGVPVGFAGRTTPPSEVTHG